MPRIIQYRAHNILSGTEMPIDNYDPENLQAMEANGFRFIAVDEYGTRSLANWQDVKNPIPDAARYVPFLTFLRFAEAVVAGDMDGAKEAYISAINEYAENNGLEVIEQRIGDD